MERLAKIGRLAGGADWLRRCYKAFPRPPWAVRSAPRSGRLVDGSVVRKAGANKRGRQGLWRLHAAFELGSEHFDHLELTDERGRSSGSTGRPPLRGKSAVPAGPICSPAELRIFTGEGGDMIIRAGWRNARWLGENGEKIDIIDGLTSAREQAVLGIPIRIGRRDADPPQGSAAGCVSQDAKKRAKARPQKSAKGRVQGGAQNSAGDTCRGGNG